MKKKNATFTRIETMPNSRRSQRKHRSTRRRQQGGAGPVGTYDLGSLSDEQGKAYTEAHRAQHGGMAPVGYTGVMEDPTLRLSARVTPLDAAIDAVKHVRDPGQAGGRRKKSRRSVGRKGRKGRKASKKTRKGRKGRKGSKARKARKTRRSTRRQRRQSGGAASYGVASDYYGDAKGPHMLLSPSMEARAGLNAEWALAKNPNSFAPQLR